VHRIFRNTEISLIDRNPLYETSRADLALSHQLKEEAILEQRKSAPVSDSSRIHRSKEREKRMFALLKRLWREDEGMEMLEWAVVAAVFVAAAAIGWQALSGSLTTGLTNAGTQLETINVIPGGGGTPAP
jgi:Flp pilus assembly pilin Flp